MQIYKPYTCRESIDFLLSNESYLQCHWNVVNFESFLLYFFRYLGKLDQEYKWTENTNWAAFFFLENQSKRMKKQVAKTRAKIYRAALSGVTPWAYNYKMKGIYFEGTNISISIFENVEKDQQHKAFSMNIMVNEELDQTQYFKSTCNVLRAFVDSLFIIGVNSTNLYHESFKDFYSYYFNKIEKYFHLENEDVRTLVYIQKISRSLGFIE